MPSEAISAVKGRRLSTFGRIRSRGFKETQKKLQRELLPELAVDTSGPIDLDALLPVAIERALEIGFGNGEHLERMALARPDMGFIGCEPFQNGVMSLLGRVERGNIKNLRVHMGDARDVMDRLPDSCLDRIYLLFPDPWPKLRHHKRRIVQPEFLAEVVRLLKPGAIFIAASDHEEYISWMLMHLQAEERLEWTAREASDWLQGPADWQGTHFEAKARAAGKAISFLQFRKKLR